MNYENYLDFTIGDILFSLIITIVAYMIIPIIIRIIKKEPLDKRKSFIISLINSIVIGIIFYVIKIETIENYTGGLSAGPMFLYYFINKWLLEKNFKRKNKEKSTIKKKANVKLNKKISINIEKNKILYIVISILLITNIIFLILFLNSNKDNNEVVKDEEGENIELDEDYWDEAIPEDCVFMITEDVEYIEIRANSSSGVGDVFSKTVPKMKYLIYDNKIGDIIYVNYKLNGDESRYECNEDWYSITLSDGTEGFVWGGRKGMYVKEY